MSQVTAVENPIFAKFRIPLIALILVCSTWTLLLVSSWLIDTKIPLSTVKFISWDEYQFLPEIDIRQNALLRLDFLSFFAEQEKFGYGDFFFQSYSALSLPFRYLIAKDSSWFLFYLRSITLLISLGSLIVSFKLVGLMNMRPAESQLILLFFLGCMPGLLLVYKPFSPDYLSLFLLLVAFFLIETNRRKPIHLLAFFCLGMGIATKIYAVFLLPIFYMSILEIASQTRGKSLRLNTGSLCAGFLAANSSLLFNNPLIFMGKYFRLGKAMSGDDFQHAIRPPGFVNRIHAWIDNPNSDSLIGINSRGVSYEFFIIPVLIFILVLIFLSLKNRNVRYATKEKAGIMPIRPSLILLIATAAFLTTIFITNRVWTWYLISPIFFMAIGLASQLPCESLFFKRTFYLVLALNLASMIMSLNEKFHELHQSKSLAIPHILEYYNNYSLPVKKLIAVDEGYQHFIVQHNTPLDPIMKNFSWAKSFSDLIQPGTKYISWKMPSNGDLANAYRQGFFMAYNFKDNVLLMRK